MMNKLELKEDKMLKVQFVGDDDVLNHILDREGGTKLKKERAQLLVNPQKIIKKQEYDVEEGDQEVLKDQNYVEVLGRNIQESLKNGSATDGGNKVYSFQNRKRPEKMAKLASELAKTPRKSVSFRLKNDPGIISIPQSSKGHSASDKVQPKNNDKNELQSTPPGSLRKRLIVPRSNSDSESEYSASNSEEDEGVAHESEDTNASVLSQKIQTQSRVSAPVCKGTPSKKMRRDKTCDLVEEYFEAHSSSQVLTSDRTLQKLRRAALDQILNSITEGVLDHVGTFRSVLDQLDWIIHRFKEDSSLELFLLIHNLDSQMLRGDKSQQIIGQLSSLRNIYLVASVDHLNAPLMWDHAKQSLYNWLWYETTTYSPYTEETSYENSLLVKQSGALPLSALTHVLRSLTPNARGIFRLLMKYQLDKQEDPSYTGLSFQDFYQQCREAFLVNSDLTLRAQLTEFRDHKLIRTKKGTDGVEYLIIPVDRGTLIDFLEKEEEEA
ncbi:origin recognition complex subunit 2 isoform X4 [Heterocephalus glaber]|uniref:Origin recognition complex subunit 2 n=1 Tax=Heterocephalus glaber TaxID=10181 RepID=A0AAX6S8W1_HETGA|nr:origin recognition complex subunit 2 isoform X4 [Heterocephalus glaber]